MAREGGARGGEWQGCRKTLPTHAWIPFLDEYHSASCTSTMYVSVQLSYVITVHVIHGLREFETTACRTALSASPRQLHMALSSVVRGLSLILTRRRSIGLYDVSHVSVALHEHDDLIFDLGVMQKHRRG